MYLPKNLTPIGVALVFVGLTIYSIKDDLIYAFDLSNKGVFIVSLFTMGYGIAILMLNYLRGGFFGISDRV